MSGPGPGAVAASGTRVGPYELTQVLGEGAFGRVWAAVDTRLGRKVAIKALRAEVSGDEESVARFRSEARNLAGLNHPNITMLLDIYDQGAADMMIMEFVPGRTVEAVLLAKPALALRESLAILVQATSGLAHAHAAGLIHRDIKPSNLMIAESGTMKIMDFGLARAHGSLRQTKIGSAIGTPIYLSPEQCRGAEGDDRSDQYSLAVVLFEMLAGRPPFEADNDFDLMRAHLEAPPPTLAQFVPQISRPLDRAIMRALSKKPADRFDSVTDFAREAGADAVREESSQLLRQLLTASLVPPGGATAGAVIGRVDRSDADTPRRLWPLAAAACVLAVLLAAGGGYYVLSHRIDPDAGLPAPAAKADLAGAVDSVVSGNALSVNSTTVNLYGIADTASTYEDVLAAQRTLKAAYPPTVLCYARPGHTYECHDGAQPHQDIALIAIRKGVARARDGIPETIYRTTQQAEAGK